MSVGADRAGTPRRPVSYLPSSILDEIVGARVCQIDTCLLQNGTHTFGSGPAHFDHVQRAADDPSVPRGATCDFRARIALARHMVNLESVSTYGGANEVHTLVLGQVVTGHSAFRAR